MRMRTAPLPMTTSAQSGPVKISRMPQSDSPGMDSFDRVMPPP